MEMEKTRAVVRSLWLRLVYTKAGAGVDRPGFYEKWCSDSHNRDEKLSVCTSRGKKKCDSTIVSISWPNSISKAVL